MAQTHVVRLGRPLLDRLMRLTGRSLAEDPLIRHALPDPATRSGRVAWLYGRCIAYGLRYGAVDVETEGRGLAIWLPPEAPAMRLGRCVRIGLVWAPWQLGPGASLRLQRANRCMERLHRGAIGEPHWHLCLVAVDPDAQGLGLGKALLRHGLDRCDTDRMPCYLDTANPQNRDYFRRYGFAEVGSERVDSAGPEIHAMVRSAPSG